MQTPMTMENCAELLVQDLHKYCYFRKAVHFWAQQALLPAVVAVGVVGNMLSVVVLTREPMKSSTSTYLTALAVSDLFYLLFVFTISFENYPWIVDADYYIYWKWYPYGLWLTDAASKSTWQSRHIPYLKYIIIYRVSLYSGFIQSDIILQSNIVFFL